MPAGPSQTPSTQDQHSHTGVGWGLWPVVVSAARGRCQHQGSTIWEELSASRSLPAIQNEPRLHFARAEPPQLGCEGAAAALLGFAWLGFCCLRFSCSRSLLQSICAAPAAAAMAPGPQVPAYVSLTPACLRFSCRSVESNKKLCPCCLLSPAFCHQLCPAKFPWLPGDAGAGRAALPLLVTMVPGCGASLD